MSHNISIKVTFKAFDAVQELIFPNSYTISELANYLRLVCHTYVILEMVPTNRTPTI